MVAAGRIAAALLQYTIIMPAFDTDAWISSLGGSSATFTQEAV